ncbi:MAG TPA: hypothetical protein VJN63_00785 [Thermoplasmata archaeon]|nr:hypothetical protein [Thermoplasmata archaeon]
MVGATVRAKRPAQDLVDNKTLRLPDKECGLRFVVCKHLRAPRVRSDEAG